MSEEALPFREAEFLGGKLIEMADRLLPVDKVMPGSQAKYAFEMDDVTFDVVLTVRRGK